MKGKRFFSVPYDIADLPDVTTLRLRAGGIVALGRWVALLGVLYDQEGCVDLSDVYKRKMLARKLELRKANQLEAFIGELVEIGWLDRTAWESFRHVISPGVCDQLGFKADQAYRGHLGGLAKARSDSGVEGNEGDAEGTAA